MRYFIGLMFPLFGVLWIGYLKLTNIDMTEMRFLVEYWYVHIAFYVLIMVGAFVANGKK